MKTAATYPDHFSKASAKTLEEIRRACEKLEAEGNRDYIVKHNGRHIWIEMGEKRQEVWSPLLHIEIGEQSNATYVKGQYVENPVLWVFLLIARTITFTVFFLSLAATLYKFFTHQAFDTEIMAMFAMASLWFGIYLLGKWNRRLSAKQAAELRAFSDNLV